MTRTITVRGIGSLAAKPDLTVLILSLEARAPLYEQALKQAEAGTDALRSAAVASGFGPDELKTEDFRVRTEYRDVRDRQGGCRQALAGYVCTYRYRLSFGLDAGRLSAVLSAIAASGANPAFAIEFTVREPERLREELLARAAENAQRRAEILCRASGAGLGQLLSIDCSWDEVDIVSPTRAEAGGLCLASAAEGVCCVPELEPEDLRVSDTAAFVWELR